MAVEIEKKYRVTEEQRQLVVEALEEFGAEYLGEHFEENTVFGGGILDEKLAALRIRKTADKTLLTYKQRIQSEDGAKHQTEHEVEVSDHESLKAIVENLGFEPRLVYEKRRRTWKFRSVEVVLDELPFGLFMEIEGSVMSIREAEMLLDIEELEVEHDTYPRMASRLGKAVGNVIESRF